MKYHTYRVLRASGEVETVRVPQCFNPHELAQKLSHSVVVLISPSSERKNGAPPCYHVSPQLMTGLSKIPESEYDFACLDLWSFNAWTERQKENEPCTSTASQN